MNEAVMAAIGLAGGVAVAGVLAWKFRKSCLP